MAAVTFPNSVIDDVTAEAADRALDLSFGKAVAGGYLLGFLVLGSFFFAVLSWTTDTIPTIARIGVAAGIAFWIGVMGGVVLVGRWAARNEDRLHG